MVEYHIGKQSELLDDRRATSSNLFYLQKIVTSLKFGPPRFPGFREQSIHIDVAKCRTLPADVVQELTVGLGRAAHWIEPFSWCAAV
jgi:hypothetical protein